MASVTVRIPTTAHERARRLAEAKTTTLADVIDIALGLGPVFKGGRLVG
jgi:hypothetical protein